MGITYFTNFANFANFTSAALLPKAFPSLVTSEHHRLGLLNSIINGEVRFHWARLPHLSIGGTPPRCSGSRSLSPSLLLVLLDIFLFHYNPFNPFPTPGIFSKPRPAASRLWRQHHNNSSSSSSFNQQIEDCEALPKMSGTASTGSPTFRRVQTNRSVSQENHVFSDDKLGLRPVSASSSPLLLQRESRSASRQTSFFHIHPTFLLPTKL